MLGPTLDGTIGGRAAELVDGWWSRTITGHGTIVPDGAVDLMWATGQAPWIVDRRARCSSRILR